MVKYRIIHENSNIEAPSGTFDIGRSFDCNLVLDDPSVSRIHATILKERDNLYLIDRGSRNGCTLNGDRVIGQTQLSNGDIIKIGHQKIQIATNAPRRISDNASRNTLGLSHCNNCGNWFSIEHSSCTTCGTQSPNTAPPVQHVNTADTQETEFPSTHIAVTVEAEHDDARNDTHNTIHSEQMLAGLAQKSFNQQNYTDTYRFLRHFFEISLGKKDRLSSTKEADLENATLLQIELALIQKEPSLIAELFSHYTQMERLMPRSAVEKLYASIRAIGYLASTEMHQYLETLQVRSSQFSPGEKFIHRRLSGLRSLCS